MAKTRTLFRRLRTLMWTALTLLTLLAAMLVGIGKLLMPYSVRYQPQLEARLSREFQQQVVVDSFTGEWKAFGPRISFQGVTLMGDGDVGGPDQETEQHHVVLVIQPGNVGTVESGGQGFKAEDHAGERLSDIMGAAHGAPADPADADATARPEWSFLGLYQMAHLFEGGPMVVPIFVIPGLLFAVVMAMPFIAQWKFGHIANLAVASLLVVGLIVLSAMAIRAASSLAELIRRPEASLVIVLFSEFCVLAAWFWACRLDTLVLISRLIISAPPRG